MIFIFDALFLIFLHDCIIIFLNDHNKTSENNIK